MTQPTASTSQATAAASTHPTSKTTATTTTEDPLQSLLARGHETLAALRSKETSFLAREQHSTGMDATRAIELWHCLEVTAQMLTPHYLHQYLNIEPKTARPQRQEYYSLDIPNLAPITLRFLLDGNQWRFLGYQAPGVAAGPAGPRWVYGEPSLHTFSLELALAFAQDSRERLTALQTAWEAMQAQFNVIGCSVAVTL
jgi:hypothetical protein